MQIKKDKEEIFSAHLCSFLLLLFSCFLYFSSVFLQLLELFILMFQSIL